ncbi:MAG: LpqB family beta-propeller domain-containing protein [Nocardioidaceae bacterium]|nr:LpqB family beta-propeller domain-containing protein [Nocardioidaceae bacterium]
MTRLLRPLLATVLVALTAAGCVRIPDSGIVHTIDDGVVDTGPSVRYEPPAPPAGGSPTDVVYGYLDAMLAFPVSVDVATEYLTPDAARTWRPDAGATIYRGPRATSESGTDVATATLSLSVDATLDARGRYAGAGGSTRESTWTLERVGGEWRIANPPDGLLIEQRFFESTYRPVSLYFLDASSSRLVEDPVFLPAGESLSTALVARLLRGPSGLLGGSARTAFPDGMRLDGSVPVRRDGVAEVDLSGDPGSLDQRRRELVSAQVVRTLGQVPGITGVRIDVGGAALDVAGVDRTQPVGAWTELDPPAGRGVGQVFAIRDDALVVVNGSTTAEFAGGLAGGTSDVADFRVDPRLRRIAVVPRSRDRVVVADIASEPDLVGPAAYLGAAVLKPVWDAEERLWVADRVGGGSRLSVVTEGAVRRIALGGLADTRLEGFELSPDSSRMVLIARTSDRAQRVYVASVVADEDGAPIGIADVKPLPLASAGLGQVRSVAWRSATSVVALASAGTSSPQSYVARVDGSSVTGGSLTGDSLLGDVGADRVLASGSESTPIYIGDRDQRLWLRDASGRWQRVAGGPLRVPSYPG